MALAAGDRIGPYTITGKLGEGGMGEVYRGHDAKLGRDAAIKVLPDQLAHDAERVARFEREARTLASLNHPHIAQIYGFEHEHGTLALAMEFVEGEDLAQRLTRGALALDDALPIAKQIAEGLAYAHERGIVHRDLKPANIKVTPDGVVKILDFGLAKAFDPAAESGETDSLALSPTITSPAMTQRGTILGTAAYMSPEQARGKTVDRRTDIWAFGCVLFELLSGVRLFKGEDVTETIVMVMSREPQLDALPQTTPPAIRTLLRRCLQRDKTRRLGDIHDAQLEIEDVMARPGEIPDGPGAAAFGSSLRQKLGWMLAGFAVAGAIIVGAAAAGIWPRADGADSTRAVALTAAVRTAVPLRADAPLALGSRRSPVGFDYPAVALSPDGAYLAYVSRAGADTALSLVELATGRSQTLTGTEGALHAFFSPDSRQVGFLAQDRVKTIAVEGGVVKTLAEARGPTVGRWNSDGLIYFTVFEGVALSRVPAAGGRPEPLLTLADAKVDRGSITDIFPDGRSALVTDRRGIEGQNSAVSSVAIDSRVVTPLILSGFGGRYAETGHIVFGRGGSLFAVEFDMAAGRVSGEPVVLIESVAMDSMFAIVHAATSRNGMLAHVAGGDVSIGRPVWVDRKGTVSALNLPARIYGALALTNDARRMAIHVGDAVDHLWIHDLDRDVGRRLANPNPAGWPRWSFDGRRVSFNWFTSVDGWLSRVRDVDGSTPDRLVDYPGAKGMYLAAWGPDEIVALERFGDTPRVVVTKLDRPEPLASFRGWFTSFSADGRWAAYTSDETGTAEVYVRSLPDGKVTRQISNGGGTEPFWLPSGELFYRNGQRWLATRVVTEPSLRWDPDPPQLVFDTDFVDTPGMSYAVSPDGQRLLIVKPAGPPIEPGRIPLVVNWPSALRKP